MLVPGIENVFCTYRKVEVELEEKEDEEEKKEG